MTQYEAIFTRKSTRKYDMGELSQSEISDICAFVDSAKRLHPKIKMEYKIVSSVKNIMPIKAPHYFLISSEIKEGYLENVGFVFQQVDLYMQSNGLGACWLGMARPSESIDTELTFVIALAFGRAVESPHRSISEFKRKTLAEISSGEDVRLEAVRLAPSATNSQNWFFDCNSGKIDLYQKKLNPIAALAYAKMNSLDMGIALCHLYVATEHQGSQFSFSKQAGKSLKGYSYVGTI